MRTHKNPCLSVCICGQKHPDDSTVKMAGNFLIYNKSFEREKDAHKYKIRVYLCASVVKKLPDDSAVKMADNFLIYNKSFEREKAATDIKIRVYLFASVVKKTL